jgi:hypothetical protein
MLVRGPSEKCNRLRVVGGTERRVHALLLPKTAGKAENSLTAQFDFDDYDIYVDTDRTH